MLARIVILAALVGVARVPLRAQASHGFREGAAILRTWFDHVQRDELESLAALLAPDFVFVSDGASMDGRRSWP